MMRSYAVSGHSAGRWFGFITLVLWACGGDTTSNEPPDVTSETTGVAAQDVISVDSTLPDPPDDNTGAAESTYTMKFESESTVTAPPSISLTAFAVGNDRLNVTVTAVKVPQVLGLAFHLDYDPTILEWINTEGVAVLTDAEAKGRYITRLVSPGRFVYGGARFGETSLTGSGAGPAVGLETLHGDLCHIEFKVLKAGTSPLLFPTIYRDIRQTETSPNVQWNGGSITVTQKR